MVNFLWENLFDFASGQHSTISVLKENILFQDLNFKELRMLENIVNVRNYRPGESVFRQGEVGVGMYLIAKGSVNVYVEEFAPQTGEIQPNLVTQLKQGGFFGEMALVEDNGRRSASVSAHDECVLIGFFKPDLIELVERNPSAGVKILMRLGEVLSTRLRETTAKITELKKESRK